MADPQHREVQINREVELELQLADGLLLRQVITTQPNHSHLIIVYGVSRNLILILLDKRNCMKYSERNSFSILSKDIIVVYLHVHPIFVSLMIDGQTGSGKTH